LQLVDEFGFVTAPRERAGPIGHCRPFRPVEIRIRFTRDREAVNLDGTRASLPDGTTLDRGLEERRFRTRCPLY
jgi:hypothetical protein